MTALICGSIAYDNIMVFNDRFKHHILPENIHILNVSFLVPEMRKEFGGCAGNIAYNLQLLGSEGYAMATVGADFTPYADWMKKNGVLQEHVSIVDETFTAQAFITTDLDDNQITAFHPGAMNYSHNNSVTSAKNISIGMVSPDGREGMILHAEEFAAAGIPFIFDPGQGMPMFNGEDLVKFIDQASYVAVNDYEWQLMQDRTGLSAEDVASRIKALVITRGAEGSLIIADGKEIVVPAAKVQTIKDPTGCGDAYRAGLLYGIMNGLDWDTTGRVAALMGAIKVESQGTQNHSFEISDFEQRYKSEFGREL